VPENEAVPGEASGEEAMKASLISVFLAAVSAAVVGGCDMIDDFHQGVGGSVHSQGNRQHGSNLLAELRLSKAQQDQISGLFTALHEEMAALHSTANLSAAQKAARLTNLHKEAESELKQILTPAQQSKFAAMGGWHGLAAAHMHGMHAALAKLELSKAQAEQLHALFAEGHAAAEAIKKDTSLSADQRNSRMSQLHLEAMTKVHGILTPAQMAKLHGMLKMGHQ
jgi:Spy/CpxP family protein refolding chaperone